MSEPTYEDAKIMLQLYQVWAEQGINKAMNFVWSPDFDADYATFIKKHPAGSGKYDKVLQLLGAMETMGVLWKNNLLNEDLIFDWINVARLWNRVGGIAMGLRQAAGTPRLFEFFEAMAAKDSN